MAPGVGPRPRTHSPERRAPARGKHLRRHRRRDADRRRRGLAATTPARSSGGLVATSGRPRADGRDRRATANGSRPVQVRC